MTVARGTEAEDARYGGLKREPAGFGALIVMVGLEAQERAGEDAR